MPSSLPAANFVETPLMVVQHPLSNAVSCVRYHSYWMQVRGEQSDAMKPVHFVAPTCADCVR